MNIGETERDFLDRVRAALAERGRPVPLPDELQIARVIGSEREAVGDFVTRAEQAKSHAYRVVNETALVEKIVELVRQMGATSALVPADGLPGRDRIIERLQKEGVRLCDSDDPDAGFSSDVAITGVERAIAETGSICLTSGGGRRRLASLAVPIHIGVIRADQIVPDLLDWAATAATNRPACETLVSAPSKTADIELVLVMGVHGPKEEHLIIVEEAEKTK